MVYANRLSQLFICQISNYNYNTSKINYLWINSLANFFNKHIIIVVVSSQQKKGINMKTLQSHIVDAKSDWHTSPHLCGGLLGALIVIVSVIVTIAVARSGWL